MGLWAPRRDSGRSHDRPKVSQFSALRMASPVTIILLMTIMQPLGDQDPRAPPLPTPLSLKHIFTQPDCSLMLMSSCCSRSITDSLSIRSTSHWRNESSLMAAYSWMKACGCCDAWSSVSSFLHCSRSPSLSLTFCRGSISSTPMTPFENKKSMMPAGLMLVTTVWCSFWNLTFRTAFDSTQLNVKLDPQAAEFCRLPYYYSISQKKRQGRIRLAGKPLGEMNALATVISEY